ncbi:sugar-binding protein [Alteromonadaceae bacterium BrNp21-10]|nr:sugar-binding protein [Alteromonadaceae bacterium BrNp21-10]
MKYSDMRSSISLNSAKYLKCSLMSLTIVSGLLIPTFAVELAFPPEQLTATFVGAAFDGSSPITVDGIRDNAYPLQGAAIDNAKNGAANADIVTNTHGTIRSVWDGRTLYMFVEVNDDTPSLNPTLPAWGASSATNFDGVEFALDFWNDKIDKFEDDDGLFTISRDGKLTYLPNGGVINHQSVHAFRDGREYSNRIKDFAVTSTAQGYTVELAIEIYGAPLQNGTSFGIDVMIGDAPQDNTNRNARVYWSHQDNSYRASSPDGNVDWGTVTLEGWNGSDAFAFSNWNLTNPIRWAESISLPKGVWIESTETELNAALTEGHATLNAVANATNQAAQSSIDASAARVEQAIAGLRWADTRYPDPMDLPSLFTLPNPWTFFDQTPVESPAEWRGENGRRAEILDLAQFYEYGYKPGAPDAFSVTGITNKPADPGFCFGTFCFVPPSPAHPAINVSITYNGITAPMSFDLFLPSNEQRISAGHDNGPVPVVLSFGGYIEDYVAAGFAVMVVPTSVTTDDRNNPWGARSGTFRTFFPYARNGDVNEISNEMAAAWGASRAIDALEMAVNQNVEFTGFGPASEFVAADKLAVTGFSINGKYAFVSGVYDDRIDVTIPGAAGATGPEPYRYVNSGHQYSWGESGGQEVMGDTIRHNPGRTTELFRRFLEPFHFYERKEGAWGYGDRLPFDQNDLVATLAPRAIVLHHTIDDYGNGSEGDALSLTVSKIIYNWLGYDADDLVKFNLRATGGHGEDSSQRIRTAEYLDHYFYAIPMSEPVATHLNTNPFLDDGAYDTYFGGIETLAPWMNSRDIELDVAVTPTQITEMRDATLNVEVTGSNLKDRELTAYLIKDGTEIANTPVIANNNDWNGIWQGSIHFAAASVNSGSYKVVVKVASNDAQVDTNLTILAKGDINGDGVISAQDILALRQFMRSSVDDCNTCDLDSDGMITSKDLRALALLIRAQ